ncbi:hypothetical protein BH24ACT19_BH24ACT19_18350 [soil metagenome]
MCGRSYVGRETGIGTRRVRGPFGLDAEKMSPGARVVVALSVLGPVALSGVLLALTPVWWIFTTYSWVAFPALGLLGSGIAGLREGRPVRVSEEAGERELLEALKDHGEVTPAGVAAETSLTVVEADRTLRELAESGHLEVRVRGGGIFYALWEAEGRISGVR